MVCQTPQLGPRAKGSVLSTGGSNSRARRSGKGPHATPPPEEGTAARRDGLRSSETRRRVFLKHLRGCRVHTLLGSTKPGPRDRRAGHVCTRHAERPPAPGAASTGPSRPESRPRDEPAPAASGAEAGTAQVPVPDGRLRSELGREFAVVRTTRTPPVFRWQRAQHPERNRFPEPPLGRNARRRRRQDVTDGRTGRRRPPLARRTPRTRARPLPPAAVLRRGHVPPGRGRAHLASARRAGPGTASVSRSAGGGRGASGGDGPAGVGNRRGQRAPRGTHRARPDTRGRQGGGQERSAEGGRGSPPSGLGPRAP